MNKERIYTVNIKGNSITKKEILECVNKFEEIRNDNHSNPELEIIAINEIIDFDFTLVGHFILFKKAIPSLKIKLFLLENKPYKDDLDDVKQRSVLWKLRQAMVHSYYSTSENVFSVIDRNGEISDAEFRKNSWFVLSRKVLPLIFLNEKNYKYTFETPLNFISVLKIVKSKVGTQTEEEIYQVCRRYLFNRKNGSNYIHILSQLAFYRALQAAKILRYYLINHLENQKEHIDIKEKLLQIGAVKNKNTINEYQKNVISIFDELFKKPPIFHLVYFSLTSSELISSTITKKNIKDEKERLFNLWDFTEELVYGINEIAKNIVQHSTTKQGVITGYINNNELNLNVFDYGNEGVLNTLLKSTENTFKKLNSQNVLKKIFNEDLERIKSNKFQFHNLFETNNENFLNQQTKRATAHLGLLIFSKLISENNGRLYTHSYNANSNHIDEYSNYESKKISIPLGTNYEILLPLKFDGKDKSKYYQKRSSPTSRGVKDKVTIEKLLKFKEIKLPRDNSSIKSTLKDNFIINVFLQNNSFSYREFEDEIWKDVISYFKKTEISNIKDGNSVFCLNFNEVQRIDASQLFRFLGKWEIEFPTINLVIYNIRTRLYFDLIKINKSFLYPKNELPYWNSDSITLIYSFEELEAQRRFYFTDVLWGQKQEDFFYINSLIKNTNYNALNYHPDFDSEKTYNSSLIDSNMFYDGLTLLPFDLILSDRTNTSLFEYNSKALLCNELKIQIENEGELKKDDNTPEINYIKKEIEKLPGFKISNSHFKLGSKIHISDFYYAKRFFQNSFFASRFAFILAKYIYEKHLSRTDSNNVKDLTIIGYGLYSELLLSLIVSFIDKHLKNEKKSININHNLYNDTEELKLIKGYVSIKKNVIILVPIASTFTTSMKIEEDLQKGTDKKNILEHINVLVVSNGKMKDKSVLSEDDIEFKYGWRKIIDKDKTVDVISYFNQNEIRRQKYFLSLPSKWLPIKNCDICFPNNINNNCITTECKGCDNKYIKNKCPLSEKILLGTDKTSVTPTLIFDFPKAREISEMENNLFELKNNALEYGHTIRNNNHFHYHIYDEVFYKDNITSIEKWIDDVKEKYFTEKTCLNYSDTDNVLIIAPKHFSNTVFVNMINKMLFANSANVLHYDFWKNNIENFQIFYKDAVHKADKIIFVDDTIISGSTFFRSNDFIKHTRNSNYGFDACIFLINRINTYTQLKIRKELDSGVRFFSFANLHLPALKDNGTECQLCVERDRTEKLFEESFLDRFKDSFYERIQKLTPKEISFNFSDKKQEKIPFEDERQNLIKVEAIHRIYEYFTIKRNKEYFINNDDFGNWQNDLLKQTKSPFEDELMKGKYSNEIISINTAILLKILAFPPFNIYRPIKEKTFKWTNNLLNRQIEKIKNSEYIKFEYLDFRDLKFLIRRAGIINSNYLISERFLEFIINLYQGGRLKEIRDIANKHYKEHSINIYTETEKSIVHNIDDFATYIVSQIKELIYENEARSILLEGRIINFLSKIEDSKELKQLFRLLQEENSILIHRFVEFVDSKWKLDDTYQTVLDNLKEQNHYQYTTLCDFFEAAKEEAPIENERFKKYLDIQYFLSHSEEESSNSLEEKTHSLGKMVKELVFGKNTDKQGAFLLIKYKTSDEKEITNNDNLKNIFLAYNSGYGQSNIELNWNEKNTYITNFINGAKNTNGKFIITIEELKRVKKGWISLYATPDDPINVDFLSQIEDVNYVLLLRFSICEIVNSKQKKESQGVMVFYSKSEIFSITQSRYLLLLKQSISRFIEKHHKNAEFKDWVEQKERLRISEKEKGRYIKAFHNFDHKVVSKVIEQWGYIENTTRTNDGFSSSSYRIGSNIINSHFYSFISRKNPINSLLKDIECSKSNQLLPEYFKEILSSMVSNDLSVELTFDLSEKIGIGIEKYALRAFIILFLQNIEKYTEGVLCTSVRVILNNTEIEIINTFRDEYEQKEIDTFKEKKKLINSFNTDELEGTTLVTIKKYCEERNVKLDFDLNNDTKQFFIKITNYEE